MQYEIITDISKDGMIIQTLIEDKIHELSRWACNTREADIIQALIKLGWTPPNKSLNSDPQS